MRFIFALFAICILLQLAPSSPAQAQKQKVIFDCDLGGDIDDAFALALLLCSQDELEILGITVGHGYTPGRATLACKILYQTGLEHIPVYAGEHTPTVVGKDNALEGASEQMKWSEGFDKKLPEPESAADFIIRSLNEYPNEIVVFTVGPVDNMAAILDREPDILQKAKQVVSMLGSIEKGYGGGAPSAEWNVRGSIKAARKLLASGANLTLAPLDVTDHVIMTQEYLQAIGMRDTPLTLALGNLYALWYRHADWAMEAKMFDGVAIGMVLWPELFVTREASVWVDDEGYTRTTENQPANCSIGVHIKDQIFLQRMYRRLIEQQFSRK